MPIFVAATNKAGQRIWMHNPTYYSGDFILEFSSESPAIVFPMAEGKILLMHRQQAQSILDNSEIPWSCTRYSTPSVEVRTGPIVGACVIWPFNLAGCVPYSIVRRCEYIHYDSPEGDSYITYGGT